MVETSGFFNGRQEFDQDGNVLTHEDGSPRLDREYTAAEFAQMFSLYLTNGIRNGGTNLMVNAAGGLMVRVMPGDGMINGYFYRLRDEGRLIQLERNIAASARIDRLVLRLDLRQDEGRTITLAVKRGDTSLTRNNEIWELGLADITLLHSQGELTQAQIRDLRLDSSSCGLINSLVQMDTTGLFSQLDAYFAKRRGDWDDQLAAHGSWASGVESEWRDWFDKIRAELFAQINTSYDDWSRRGGYTNEVNIEAARISERLFNTNNNATLATRVTTIASNEVNEAVTWTSPALRVNKRTSFHGSRIIETFTEI